MVVYEPIPGAVAAVESAVAVVAAVAVVVVVVAVVAVVAVVGVVAAAVAAAAVAAWVSVAGELRGYGEIEFAEAVTVVKQSAAKQLVMDRDWRRWAT